VSISTASRVLNNRETPVAISEDTRRKVVEVARAVGYVPSAAGRALRKGLTRTIGVLGNSPEIFLASVRIEGLDTEMMRALMSEAVREHFHVLLLTGVSSGGASYNTQIAELGMVDGIIVYNRDLSAGDDYMEAVRNAGKPVVYLLEYPEHGDACFCAPDDVQGGRLAAEKLLETGHSRIGFLQQAGYPGIFGRRRAGWAQALRKAGIVPEDTWTLDLGSITPDVWKRERLTALVCANQWQAHRFQTRIAATLGVSVPKDVSVVPITCEPASAPSAHNLARVSTPIGPMVSRGMAMLLNLMAETAVAEPRCVFPFSFEPGPSIAPARAANSGKAGSASSEQ
jgi:LacI family transcriptional regulator